jgi:hypothetical protein
MSNKNKYIGGYVYFIRASGEGGLIKIGISHNPKNRFNNIQTGSPVILYLEAYAPGDGFDEKYLHEKFQIYRRHGEWFTPDSSIIECIDYVKNVGKLPHKVSPPIG